MRCDYDYNLGHSSYKVTLKGNYDGDFKYKIKGLNVQIISPKPGILSNIEVFTPQALHLDEARIFGL